jgi:hypothetical protein
MALNRQEDQALFERLVPLYHASPVEDTEKYRILEEYRSQGLDWGAAMQETLLALAALPLLNAAQEYDDAIAGQQIYQDIQEG